MGIWIMEKKDIQDALEEIALLLELKGENPFKIRAHRNAARALKVVSADIRELAAANALQNIDGIGKGIAAKIGEMVASGRSSTLDKLRAEFPDTIIELFRVPGLGSKKVKTLYEKLGIATLGELEYACRENRLVELEGFGPATQEKILAEIEFIQTQTGRHLQHRALSTAEMLVAFLRDHPQVSHAEIAGSLRRRLELVKDIDLVAACPAGSRAQVTRDFLAQEIVAETISTGETKTSVRLLSNIAADLRLVAEDQFPFALMHFTGSKEHNIVMRHRAQTRGLKLNEYGLHRNGDSILATDETEIFAALDLPLIAPELREDRGELDAAERGKLPQLVDYQDIKGMLHVHSTYSDGTNTLTELAQRCREMGFTYLGISDHSQSAAYAGGLREDDVLRQHDEIDKLNGQFDDFTIFKGIESDILSDGSLDYPDTILTHFDFIIASVHSRLNMPIEEATERIIRAIENPYTTILGHPTGRLLAAREGYPLDMERVIEAATEHNTVIELNASPHRLDLDWRYLRQARDHGIKVAINPDAHSLEGLADIRFGIGIARKGWLRAGDVINTRSRDDFASFLQARHP